MTRKSMIVYNYHPVPDQLPASNIKGSFIDALDAAIEGLWSPEIKVLMQPIGHPQSKRFFINQYKAAGLTKATPRLAWAQPHHPPIPTIGRSCPYARRSQPSRHFPASVAHHRLDSCGIRDKRLACERPAFFNGSGCYGQSD